jgi:DNA-binding XRE family transcriptional regulator
MSRHATHRSIIREIRKICGWTQTGLANQIGTTTITVNRIENDSLKVSKKLALRISWVTGVSTEDILKNKPGHPQTPSGPLTKDKIKELEVMSQRATEEQQRYLAQFAAEHVAFLVQACLDDSPRKLWSLQAAIKSAVEEIAEDFGLTKAFKKAKGPSSSFALLRWAMTYEPNREFGMIKLKPDGTLVMGPAQDTREKSAKKPGPPAV